MRKTKVAYIVGVGHNGSTLLDLILGESDSIVSTSQLCDLFSRYTPDSKVRASDALWEELGAKLSDSERPELITANLGILREQSLLPFLVSRKKRARYVSANQLVFRFLAKKFPRHCIVDSSKNVSRALGIAADPELDVFFIHLVRDCRGYIDSN